jgi:acyl-CoA thioesterase-1
MLRAIVFALCLAASSASAAAATILVYGDSLSAAYGIGQKDGWVSLLGGRLEQTRPDYSVVNASISGETTAGGAARIDAALGRFKPDVVVLALGGNDGLRGLPVAEMKANLAKIVRASQSRGARVLVVGMRIPPNYGARYAQAFYDAFGEVARETKSAYVPFLLAGIADRRELFQPDQIHPTAEAQPLLLDTVWQGLEPLLKKQPRVGESARVRER